KPPRPYEINAASIHEGGWCINTKIIAKGKCQHVIMSKPNSDVFSMTLKVGRSLRYYFSQPMLLRKITFLVVESQIRYHTLAIIIGNLIYKLNSKRNSDCQCDNNYKRCDRH
ncbi:hypothetical protein A3Q56_08595, partial [Intoshia linei]